MGGGDANLIIIAIFFMLHYVMIIHYIIDGIKN